jgi:hypothetical protein
MDQRKKLNELIETINEKDDLLDDHLAMIKQQNDHIATLNAKIAEHELENEKFKIARIVLYNGRRPDIKNGIGFQQREPRQCQA